MSSGVDWGETSGGSDADQERTYWAAEEEPTKLCRRFRRQLDRYRRWLTDTQRRDRIQRTWNCSWGFSPDGGGDSTQMTPSGGQGEMLEVNTNSVATLISQTSAIILNQRPAGKAVARNGDFSSLTQTEFAEGLLEYLEGELGWEEYDALLLDIALRCSESWLIDGWDRALGQAQTPDPTTGAPIYSGDISTLVATPFDVCYDPAVQDPRKLEWFAFRYRVNRFAWAKRFPKCADYFLDYSPEQGGDEGWSRDEDWDLTHWGSKGFRDASNAYVTIWELRHLPSYALAPGRLVRFLGPEHIISDSLLPGDDGRPGGYPYVSGESARLHAYQVRAQPIAGSMAGYSPHFDLLSLQEAKDVGMTAVVSGLNAGGLDNIYVGPEGSTQTTALGGGLKIWEGPTEPKRIQGPQFSPAVVPALGLFDKEMLARVALNSLSVGEQHHQMPAQLAALLQAQTVQSVNSLQGSMRRAYCESRTGRLYLYKEFADDKRVAMIAGAGQSWAMKEWTGKDLDGIERFIVEEVPAVLNTVAGKMQLADQLMAHEKIASAEEYLTLVSTGRLEPLFQGKQQNLLRIQQEKELLMRGVGLPPIQTTPQGQPIMGANGLPMFQNVQGEFIRPAITDTPWLDIPECASVIANPVTRNNPAVVKAVTELNSYRMALWHQMPPVLQALLGCPPELTAMMAPIPSPPPGAAPGEARVPPGEAHPPEPGGPSHVPAGAKPAAPLPQGSPNIRLPQAPRAAQAAGTPIVATGTGAA